MKLGNEIRKDGDIEPENEKLRQKLFNEAEQVELDLDKDIFSNPYVEIKTSSLAQVLSTGNLFIEYQAKYPERTEPIPSGIKTTKSPYWVFNFRDDNGVVNDVVYIFSVEHLSKTIKRGLNEGWVISEDTELSTGDINSGYLVPIMMLLKDFWYSTKDHIEVVLNKKKTLYKQHQQQQNLKRRKEMYELSEKKRKNE